MCIRNIRVSAYVLFPTTQCVGEKAIINGTHKSSKTFVLMYYCVYKCM